MSKTEANSLSLYLWYCIIMNHHSLLKALWLHMYKMWTLFLKFRATGFQEMWQSHQFDSFEYLFILTICITSSLITSKYIKDTNYLWNTEINKMINLFWTSTTKRRERLVNNCLQFTECNSILYNKKRRNMWESSSLKEVQRCLSLIWLRVSRTQSGDELGLEVEEWRMSTPGRIQSL